MSKVLIIGAGGVGGVVAHKCAMDRATFSEIMLASRTVARCDKLAAEIEHHLIPTAVFSQPPASTIGLSEPAAIAAGFEPAIFRAKFRPMRYALSGRDETVFIKLVVDRLTDKVLGLHMTGPDAPEIIQAAAIAITMGATKADLDRTFALHPTTAEELVLLK